MTFGLVKTTIEKNLVESYKDSSNFKQTLREFKHNVLNDKSFSKVYSIYDDLSKPQGLTESDAREFLEESIKVIQHFLSKTNLPKHGQVNKNLYEDIDNLVYFDKVQIKERVESKKRILGVLKESVQTAKDSPKIPLKTMVSIANQTIGKYVENLDENTKKEFFHIIASKTDELENEFSTLKESAVNKLKVILSKEEESEIKNKISETIQKIESEKFDQVSYVKLKQLEESIVLDS